MWPLQIIFKSQAVSFNQCTGEDLKLNTIPEEEIGILIQFSLMLLNDLV